jgi:acetolactate synthase-1/2/3 large subunit
MPTIGASPCALVRNAYVLGGKRRVAVIENGAIRSDDGDAHHWQQLAPGDTSDAILAAMTAAGIDHLFFTSGAEIVFFQEAVAKARAQGRPAPRLITMTHEHASLNAALGYAAVSGRAAATVAHVDAGTLNYGAAIHTAWRSGLPVLITAGGGPASYPGSMPGARDGGGHIWMQQPIDQNGIVRQYMKWDHRLEYQDNPGLIVSRALQVALTEPRGPAYLTIPKEIGLLPARDTSFPNVDQLGVPLPAAPNPAGIREIAHRLAHAQTPVIVVSSSGRNPQTVPALVTLCERLAIGVVYSSPRAYHSFPLNHALHQDASALKDADLVLVIDAAVPWIPGGDAPPKTAYVAVLDADPIRTRIPTYEFTANLRVGSDPLLGIEALSAALSEFAGSSDRVRIAKRMDRWTARSIERARTAEERANAVAAANPISPLWLSHEIGAVLSDECIVFDEALPHNRIADYLRSNRPASYFGNPGTSGGWAPGAALGAKLAAPDRDVVAITGDGFYMYSTASAAMWAAAHYGAPFLTIVYQNRSYSTGTLRVKSTYPDSFAAKGGYDGGYFDPPVDFARDAHSAGAFGENVRDPADIRAAITRGLRSIRAGKPAVIAVWLPKLLEPS